MHQSVMNFVARHLSLSEVRGRRVLEVGSYDVNGSVRPIVAKLGPSEYLGTDMRPGPGVDVVADITQGAHLGLFDVIISTETLEHVQDWRLIIDSMKRMLSVGGVLVLTTRSWGFPLHEYPGDFWRFEIADMANIFSDMHIAALESDPMVPGVFVKAMDSQHGYDAQGVRVLRDLTTLHARAMETGA